MALDPTSVELLLATATAPPEPMAWSTGSCSAATPGVIRGGPLGHQALHCLSLPRRPRRLWLHDLRHFMANMLAAGVPVPVVSERLGHARTSTTVNIYAHAMPGGDRAAVELLAELLTLARDRAVGRPAQTGLRGLIP